MKKIKFVLMFLILVLFGCSNKLNLKNNDFIYKIKNFESEKYLYNKIKSYKENVFFELYDVSDKGYTFHVIPCDNINKAYFGFLKVTKANRVLVLNNNPYYLVFGTDELLGTTYEKNVDKNDTIRIYNDDECLNCQKIKYNVVIIDRGFVIKFDRDWNIIESD
ncbi:hypothetical protein OX283_008345 [Flavobacterium sp. SUN052]|uniref:hypothetical protein n=1 Tax=Flavobacterium sp. SUN052 TaxID=3002441 RepID=UPI00237E00B4|nr:hypothetical protein [Flavobacterium sp. SUN052]MEC4004663.1 hypothetical protein [Flavobacterium sp. SUN052]